jgi:hypothetical protein
LISPTYIAGPQVAGAGRKAVGEDAYFVENIAPSSSSGGTLRTLNASSATTRISLSRDEESPIGKIRNVQAGPRLILKSRGFAVLPRK